MDQEGESNMGEPQRVPIFFRHNHKEKKMGRGCEFGRKANESSNPGSVFVPSDLGQVTYHF